MRELELEGDIKKCIKKGVSIQMLFGLCPEQLDGYDLLLFGGTFCCDLIALIALCV